MASEKQIQYIKKLAAWKKQVLPANLEDLPHADASALIDKWKALKSQNGDVEAEKQAELESVEEVSVLRAFNAIQAGMAKKVVANQLAPDWVAAHPEEFAQLVEGVYNAFELADDVIRSKRLGGGAQ